MKTLRGFIVGLVLVLGAVLLMAPAPRGGPFADLQDTQNHGAIPIFDCMTINTPGSYVVVQNLDAVGDCLLVTADNVSINLGGHVLSGDGTGSGVTTDGTVFARRSGIAVHDGTVRGFSVGIQFFAANDTTVRGVRVLQNTGTGISFSVGATIAGNTTTGNGGNGISGFGGIVTGNTATSNGGVGISVGTHSTVTGNTATSNIGGGIIGSVGSTVSGNTAGLNGDGDDAGIFVACPSNVFDNTATFNDNVNLLLGGTPTDCLTNNNLAP